MILKIKNNDIKQMGGYVRHLGELNVRLKGRNSTFKKKSSSFENYCSCLELSRSPPMIFLDISIPQILNLPLLTGKTKI
jgi:hypothetical protein